MLGFFLRPQGPRGSMHFLLATVYFIVHQVMPHFTREAGPLCGTLAPSLFVWAPLHSCMSVCIKWVCLFKDVWEAMLWLFWGEDCYRALWTKFVSSTDWLNQHFEQHLLHRLYCYEPKAVWNSVVQNNSFFPRMNRGSAGLHGVGENHLFLSWSHEADLWALAFPLAVIYTGQLF